MSVIEKIFGYVQTHDNGEYILDGDVMRVIKSGDNDEDLEPVSVQQMVKCIDPNLIYTISPNGPYDEEANWCVTFSNNTSHTYYGPHEVRQFIKLYQMLKD